MNELDYCREKAAPPGSNVYYSLLKLPKEHYNAILILRAFYQEITEIIQTCQEPQVALAKLHWWQAELHQVEIRQPTHPITKALLTLEKSFSISINILNEIIESVIQDLHNLMYQTEDVLLQFYQNSAGKLEKQLANIYHCENEQTLLSLEKFGIFITQVQKLRDLRRLMQQGRTYLAAETLMQHQVTLQQLSTFTMNQNILQLFQHQASLAKNTYQQALLALPKQDRKKILPSYRLAKLHAVLLDEIIAANFPVLTQKISLTPLRKWWIAWRVI